MPNDKSSIIQTDSSEHTDELVCPACGYNLFGIGHTNKCPECGSEIDRTAINRPRLPWSHRQKIGEVEAFMQTVLLATFRVRRISDEICRPVYDSDARVFRLACVVTGFIPIYISVAYLAANSKLRLSPWQWSAGLILVGTALWLFIIAATSIPGLFCTGMYFSAKVRDRAILLSYYMAAPLVWVWIPFLLCVIDIALRPPMGMIVPIPSPVLMVESAARVSAIAVALSLFASPIFFVYRISRSMILAAGAFFALPICWAGLALILLAGLPGTALCLAIIFSSLS